MFWRGYGRWIQGLVAMQEEMKSLHENDTNEMVKLPKAWELMRTSGRIGSRMKIKIQRKGVYFEEFFFPPILKMSSIQAVLGLVAILDLEIE